MFKAPFSFSGRITRTEYLLSGLILLVTYALALSIMFSDVGAAPIGVLVMIPGIWFAVAQGWKRSQDAGWHGVVAIIPYVNFVLLFVSGDQGANAYGPNPRLNGTEPANPSAGQTAFTPPPLPDAWERARHAPAPAFRISSFKCRACGAQNTNVEHQGAACCQFCGAPKA